MKSNRFQGRNKQNSIANIKRTTAISVQLNAYYTGTIARAIFTFRARSWINAEINLGGDNQKAAREHGERKSLAEPGNRHGK